ncbi:multidrug transporter AcrB [Acinetobacter pittii]|uniref:efflux RND transporter permease subunit n=1 Tax=Acinetobacter calcoaceticus/baumannii complex TaxID=909768 RepID=UPI00029DD5C0|nr:MULTISPECIES: efflux RND transporter permease subunit [Acinetobacter calcoaceticus/baumannii complex]AUT32623.1 efflux RND transporter permease subunit [Acinetobacter pittii]EKU67649.1 RND transporter, Hydrophobe/Amphiphile Efflux-1 (HAE1)/Heavy Metal Efflux (HME) family, permease protein [Acinetobacter pittii]EXG30237.1 MMPL family protein [Acinetobacter sp. 263903-2]KRJ06757.1 multidrug transporter AcrB [Acinetobacter pittii]MCE6395330.1 efflux RND transporter permease subunit [Acinetobac
MKFNLSEWALNNKGIVLYFMLLLGIIGAISYSKLSQSEDPPFTFKVMVVQTYWPGATAKEVSTLVTDRIEKELMTTGQYDKIMAYSRPGESMVTFVAKDSLTSAQIPDVWYNVRKKVNDIRHELPNGVQGPFFNDEFGDTFGNIYVLTGKDFDYALLKEYADRLQLQLQRVKDVSKVELIGLQDQKIWVEISNTKAVQLGIPVTAIQEALQKQNSMASAGFFETGTDRIQIRVSGHLQNIDEIKKTPLLVGDKTIQLGDVADVYRGFSQPAQPRMRFMGENGIGIAVSMRKGGDIIALGKNLETEFAQLQKTLPLGMKLQKVSDQPVAVQRSIHEFVKVLAEAVIIVLLVSFFSLGFRTGLVVAFSIPLVLAMTFAGMSLFDVGLHKISLGALILALGLLVDDAIIAVEMMAIKMEQGYSRIKAAGFAWKTTAFPMLTGTLITAAGFLPIATAQSSTGEYTRSIFQVVTIALLVSWIAAVLFVPYLGEKLLPDFTKLGHQAPWYVRLWARLTKKPQPQTVAISQDHHYDPYQSSFYLRFRKMVEFCVTYRKTVIATTVGIFVLSVLMFKMVPQQFFPPSNRAEILVDLKLEEGASLTATEQAVKKVEKFLSKQKGIDNYVAYVGTGSPRFYLPLDQQLPQASFAQFVVLASSLDDRDDIRRSLETQIKQLLPQVRTRVSLLENGPPVGYPLQYRVSGEDLNLVRKEAQQVAKVMSENPNTTNVHLDWGEPSKIISIQIDQDRARQMGVSSLDLANFINASITDSAIEQYREKRELIEIRLRGDQAERVEVASLASLAVPTNNGTTVPLAQIAKIEYKFEDGLIWHRNRLPTITVRADIRTNLQPATVVGELAESMDKLRAELPSGYLIEVGGTVEESARGQDSVNAGMPLFLAVVMTLLMIQLKSLSRSTIVLLTAPLGLIGVVLFLLLFNKPFGFVAMLGTIALSGMIMRNSLILIDQIEQDRQAGHPTWEAIIEATVRRFRPIILTALAAVLAMIPLSRSIFFGPMAVAIMGGLIVATLLTLFFLPALYAAWFKVKKTA